MQTHWKIAPSKSLRINLANNQSPKNLSTRTCSLLNTPLSILHSMKRQRTSTIQAPKNKLSLQISTPSPKTTAFWLADSQTCRQNDNASTRKQPNTITETVLSHWRRITASWVIRSKIRPCKPSSLVRHSLYSKIRPSKRTTERRSSST